MADATELTVHRCCILWTLMKPRCERFRSSSHFNFQGCECWFELAFLTVGYHLFVKSLDEDFPMPYKATVYDLTASDGCTTTRVNRLKCPIWTQTELTYEERVNTTKDNPMVRFKVILQDCSGHVEVADQFVQTPEYFDAGPHLLALSRDYARLLDEGSDRNVELVCGDRVFQTHRIVLCTRSKVLKAMIESDTDERKMIEDTDVAFFEEFLKYLYAGILPEMTKDTIKRIYDVGDKYDMKELMEACLEFLEDNLSLGNACETLIFADRYFSRHRNVEFKAKFLNYIEEYNIPLVQDLWDDFNKNNLKLASEVLNVYCKHLADLAGVRPGVKRETSRGRR